MYVSHAATSNTTLKQPDPNQVTSSDQSAPTKHHKRTSMGAAVGISVGVIFIVILATVILGTVTWHM